MKLSYRSLQCDRPATLHRRGIEPDQFKDGVNAFLFELFRDARPHTPHFIDFRSGQNRLQFLLGEACQITDLSQMRWVAGLRELPREISTFELQSFFTYSGAERELINARRGNAHKLGLALHIGFLRLSGRLLNSVRIVPATLWRHLGDEIGIPASPVCSRSNPF